MSYLLLPPDKFIAFATDLKKRYGFIIVEQPVKVELDESRYNSGWIAWEKTYLFSYVKKNGSKSHITIQNGDGTILYAVTEDQQKCWKNRRIVSEPFGWNFGRVINYMAQLAYKCNLVSPSQDLNKLNHFLQEVFYEGEDNG